MTPGELTDEQLAFQESVRGFVERTFPAGVVAGFEREGDIPDSAWRAFADQGLLAVGVPERDGGDGGGAVELSLLVHELARASLSLAMRYLASAYSGVQTLVRCGSESQRERFLTAYLEGGFEFGLGFTEADGGTDVSTWRASAHRGDAGWRLSGSKMFTSNADHASRLIVLARTEPADAERRHRGFTLFLVDPHAPGVTRRRIPTMGLRAEGAFEVTFDDVELPPDAVLGDEGRGFYDLFGSLDVERILVAAAAVGNASAALDDAVTYAGERRAFGRPIGAFQAVQHQLADSACDVRVGWLLALDAAREFDREGACALSATMAKYVASERAFAAIHRGMRVLGGYGFTTEFPMERRFRDAQLFLTGPISSEMARSFIGERLGLPKSY